MKRKVPEVGINCFLESQMFIMDLLLLGLTQRSSGECEGDPEVVHGGF